MARERDTPVVHFLDFADAAFRRSHGVKAAAVHQICPFADIEGSIFGPIPICPFAALGMDKQVRTKPPYAVAANAGAASVRWRRMLIAALQDMSRDRSFAGMVLAEPETVLSPQPG